MKMNGFKLLTKSLVSNGFTVSRRNLLVPCSSNVNLTLVGGLYQDAVVAVLQWHSLHSLGQLTLTC